MSVPNYRGNSCIEYAGVEPKFVKVYNDTGSTISAGTPKVLSPKWITGIGVVMATTAIATKTTTDNRVGFCVSDIADAGYGLFQISGYYDNNGSGATTSGTVAANDCLEILNATTALIDAGIDGGAVLIPEAVAVAIANIATNKWSIYIIDKQSAFQAS